MAGYSYPYKTDMSAYEYGFSDVDPVTEARGMDALARTRAMRARITDTLDSSPTKHASKSPGGADPTPLYDGAATGAYGLEPAVESARSRLAFRGAVNQSADEVTPPRARIEA